jgi:hypothetical protein
MIRNRLVTNVAAAVRLTILSCFNVLLPPGH